jgi:glycerol kinase
MQFQADILGVPVDRPQLVESTAAGAAHLAGLAVGVWKGPGDLDQARRSERRFEPVMDHARREALYAGWQQAVARVRAPGNHHV